MKKIAIVTGAGGGIGKEFVALMLGEQVDEIWCVARNQGKLKLLREKWGNKIIPISLDLCLQQSITELDILLKKENPTVMYLINNAGAGEILSEFINTSVEKNREIIDLNCSAVVSLCTICIPYMGKKSKIINLSSQSSFQPLPYLCLYASTKAFVTSFTRAVNRELKNKGITATAVCAGWTDTPMLPRVLNGKKVKYPMMVCPKRVAQKALEDAKKGRDMSVCTAYVKYMQFLSKVYPHAVVMKTWEMIVSKYIQ